MLVEHPPRWKGKEDEVQCPFGMHWHQGDKIEIGLEMILCRHDAEEALKQFGWSF